MVIIFGILVSKMNKVIYFENENSRVDKCCGQTYSDFLDYAFSETDFFMLVYVNYYGKGYTRVMKDFKKKLDPFKVKSRTNPSWPGTSSTFCLNTEYKIIFYRNCEEAKRILKSVTKLSEWSSPSYPQDLAFFKGNQCWFYSVGHEKIGAIIHATDKDIDFVVTKGISSRESIRKYNEFYSSYDELLVK